MRRGVVRVLVAVIVAFAVGSFFVWTPARSVTLLAPSMFRFVKVAPDLWVERGMSAEQREGVVQAVAVAQGRVREFFGQQLGRPVVLACTTVSCFRWCGGIGHGTTYFGDRVLLGPAALNATKVTHEFVHVEIAARIGALRDLLRVPQWFGEGLAVMVSEDPVFDESSWLAATDGGRSAPDLARLATFRGWLDVTKADGQRSYGTARHEVARWYARAGRPGVECLLAALREGRAFETAYAATAETRCSRW